VKKYREYLDDRDDDDDRDDKKKKSWKDKQRDKLSKRYSERDDD
jgi:hypothetical protein